MFLAQFMGDEAPFNSLPAITEWAKSLGYLGVQLPSWDSRIMNLEKAAKSKTYCDDLKGQTNGLVITELASHLQGQLVASHPAYDELFDVFAAPEVQGNPAARSDTPVRGKTCARQALAMPRALPPKAVVTWVRSSCLSASVSCRTARDAARSPARTSSTRAWRRLPMLAVRRISAGNKPATPCRNHPAWRG